LTNNNYNGKQKSLFKSLNEIQSPGKEEYQFHRDDLNKKWNF